MRLRSAFLGLVLVAVLTVVGSAQPRLTVPVQVPTEVLLGQCAFEDVLVRQAILKAVAWSELVEGGCAGADVPVTVRYRERGSGDYTLVVWDARNIEFDQEEAKRLLTEAGYQDPLTAWLLYNDNDADYVVMAQQMQSMLNSGGFAVSLHGYPPGALLVAFMIMSDAGDNAILLGNVCDNSLTLYRAFLPLVRR